MQQCNIEPNEPFPRFQGLRLHWFLKYLYFSFYFSSCRRSVEISLALKKSFEAAILSELFPHSKIDIYIQVLQSDGGMYKFSILFLLHEWSFWILFFISFSVSFIYCASATDFVLGGVTRNFFLADVMLRKWLPCTIELDDSVPSPTRRLDEWWHVVLPLHLGDLKPSVPDYFSLL